MAARLRLEVLETPRDPRDAPLLSVGELEEAKLTAFETGYSAGWEDAVAAQDGEMRCLADALGQCLADLTFTYAEAQTHVLRALEPLLSDMISKIMPSIAHATLGPIVLEHLRPVGEELARVGVEIVLDPAVRPLVEPHLASAGVMPLRIVEEPALSPGQVFLRFADRETRIDLAAVTEAIGAAVDGYFRFELEGELAHG